MKAKKKKKSKAMPRQAEGRLGASNNLGNDLRIAMKPSQSQAVFNRSFGQEDFKNLEEEEEKKVPAPIQSIQKQAGPSLAMKQAPASNQTLDAVIRH